MLLKCESVRLRSQGSLPDLRHRRHWSAELADFESALLDLLRQFEVPDHDSSSLEAPQSEHRTKPLLYSPVVLFDGVVKVLAGPPLVKMSLRYWEPGRALLRKVQVALFQRESFLSAWQSATSMAIEFRILELRIWVAATSQYSSKKRLWRFFTGPQRRWRLRIIGRQVLRIWRESWRNSSSGRLDRHWHCKDWVLPQRLLGLGSRR